VLSRGRAMSSRQDGSPALSSRRSNIDSINRSSRASLLSLFTLAFSLFVRRLLFGSGGTSAVGSAVHSIAMLGNTDRRCRWNSTANAAPPKTSVGKSSTGSSAHRIELGRKTVKSNSH
jgi:hypothetical protein